MTHLIDPTDPKNHGKPLWVLYGDECFPSIACVELRATGADFGMLPIGQRGRGVVIWGYSVYEGKPGFRTLGLEVSEWSKRSSYGPLFYESQDLALDELRRVTTPAMP